MRKVLYIGVKSEFGGAGRSLLEMVTTINNTYEDIEPIVLCCHKKGHIDLYRERGIQALPSLHGAFNFGREDNQVRYYLKIVPRFFSYVFRNIYALIYVETHVDMKQIHLIHTNATRNDLGMILSKIHKIPHVLHIREFGTKGMDYDVKYYRPNPIKYIDDHTTKCIAITKAVKKHWVKQGISEDKISVVYNGINDKDIIKKTDYGKEGQVRFVFTGYIMETKGQRLLVEALDYVEQSVRENISVDFIGSGNASYIQKLTEFAEERGYGDKIHFLGRREDVHSILHNYDVGLVCSRAEAFGRVTAEYMLAGLTVVASDTGGNPELIDDGINGLLYSYGNPQDLAEKITQIAVDRDNRIKLSLAAKEKAERNFITEVNAGNVVKIYRDIWGKD